MKRPADKASLILQHEAGENMAAARHWQAAGDRVLLYLRCLNIAPPQAFELALAALRSAEQSMAAGSTSNPTEQAMQALHRLLSELKETSSEPPRLRSSPPFPPLQRRSMVSEGIAAAHWPSLLANLRNRFRRPRPER